MSERPLVILSISSREFSEYLLWPDMYIGLNKAGFTVVSIDTTVEPIPMADILGKADGLIIGGGGDLSPLFYGGDPRHPTLRGVNVVRDHNEFKMLEHARRLGLPVLGICRGAQLINVAHGGTLIHDLEQEFETQVQHQVREDRLDSAIHSVEVSADSHLAGLLGTNGSIEVNSGHHQGISVVGTDLRVVARSPDGLVEAIEAPGDQIILGVQWHPENLWRTQTHANQLLTGFASSCSTQTGGAPKLDF